MEKLCAPSSIHRYMDESDRTSGLGGTSTSLSLFHFVRTDFAHAYKAQLLKYRHEIVQAQCPMGGIVTSKKMLGVGPPGGKFFPKFFSSDYSPARAMCLQTFIAISQKL